MAKVININGQRYILPAGTSAKDIAALAGFMVGLVPVQQEYDYEKSEYMNYASNASAQVQLEEVALMDRAEAQARRNTTYEAYKIRNAAEKAAREAAAT